MYEVLYDVSHLLPFEFLRTGDRLGRAVVKLERPDGACGTGFLVSPDILLTNHHVLPDQPTAAACRAFANFEPHPPDDPQGRAAIVLLAPERLFLTDAELDFTFCGVSGLGHLGWIQLDRDALTIPEREAVTIIQHPRGRMKEIALRDNRVEKSNHVILQYSCDTEPGSSGSPVFNSQWRLVAMHHASVLAEALPARAAASLLGEPLYLNEGVRISAIAAWLESEQGESHVERDRVCSLFQGTDTRLGYFGALGDRAEGKGSLARVLASYEEPADRLDLGIWDLGDPPLHGVGGLERIAWVIANFNMDLWLLRSTNLSVARQLRSRLESEYRMDYRLRGVPDETNAAWTVLWQRTRGTWLEWIAPNPDRPGHLYVRVRSEPRYRAHAVRIKAQCGSSSREEVTCLEDAFPCDSQATWLVIGGTDRPKCQRTRGGTGCDARRSLRLDSGSPPCLIQVSTRSLKRLFTTPNVRVTQDIDARSSVAPGRELPCDTARLGTSAPFALRLVFREPDRLSHARRRKRGTS
jgi:hypothetical protein